MSHQSLVRLVHLAAINSPLPNVEDTWTLHHHCIQFVVQAALGYVLQAPVPIIVIIRAEEFGTVTDILPGAAVERHSHVVLTADPRRHLRLIRVPVITCYCLTKLAQN